MPPPSEGELSDVEASPYLMKPTKRWPGAAGTLVSGQRGELTHPAVSHFRTDKDFAEASYSTALGSPKTAPTERNLNTSHLVSQVAAGNCLSVEIATGSLGLSYDRAILPRK